MLETFVLVVRNWYILNKVGVALGLCIHHYSFTENQPDFDALILMAQSKFEHRVVVNVLSLDDYEIQLDGLPVSIVWLRIQQNSVELSVNLFSEPALFFALDEACIPRRL